MGEPRALWVSTCTNTRGGVATYVRTIQQTQLWTDWNIRHVATHRDGYGAAAYARVEAHFDARAVSRLIDALYCEVSR